MTEPLIFYYKIYLIYRKISKSVHQKHFDFTLILEHLKTYQYLKIKILLALIFLNFLQTQISDFLKQVKQILKYLKNRQPSTKN